LVNTFYIINNPTACAHGIFSRLFVCSAIVVVVVAAVVQPAFFVKLAVISRVAIISDPGLELLSIPLVGSY
jgi:hypothetical protein